MLLEETIKISGICTITGREDVTNKKRINLAELKLTSNLSGIVKGHTPTDLKIPKILGVDLQVSRHIHRGQMWLNH